MPSKTKENKKVPEKVKGKVIALLNPKGGVGKTTSAVNLAGGLSERGRRVLLVDLDDQQYATRWADVEVSDNLVEALLKDNPLRPVRSELGFDVVGASDGLSTLPREVAGRLELQARPNDLLSDALEEIGARDTYDYVLLDCPGDMDMVTVNGMLAADTVVLPMATASMSLSTVRRTFDRVVRLMRAFKREPRVRVMMGMYQASKRIHQDVVSEVQSDFAEGERFQTIIPFSVRLEECESHRATIFQHAGSSAPTQAFRDLTEEVLQWLED